MRRLGKLLLCTLLVLAAGVPVARAIVGGTPVPAGKYPWVARIVFGPGFQCTGTLISPTWVMTAGHCSSLTGVGAPSPIPMDPRAYTVFLGGIETDGSDSKTYSVKSVHVPPGYSVQNGNGRDVGLLELTVAVPLTPLKIAAVDERASWAAGEPVTAAGFGVTESGGDQPEVMHEVTVPVTPDATCDAAYPDGVPGVDVDFEAAVDVCAADPKGGKDTCQGDSGGPLMSRVGSGLRLVGATSRGEGCAEEGKPGVYARIAEGELRMFVAGLVPDAFEAEGTPDGSTGQTGPSATATATPEPVAPGSPTPTPAPGTRTSCAGRPGLSFRVRSREGQRLRKVRVRLNGRTILNRKGRLKPFTVRLARRLRADGTAKVRVFTRSANGVRRVEVRTFDGCQQTSVRTRVKR
jgi:trypsin